VASLPLNGLAAAWRAIPRRRQIMSKSHVAACEAVIARFIDYLALHSPEASEMADVTHEMAQAFMAAERARGVAGRTYNVTLSLLKGCFRHLRRQAGIIDNPFEEIVGIEEDTVHRIPFTPEDLRAILDVVKDDSFCRPLIVTGICTAMRRGDVCLLRWSSVDFKGGFITVATSKTGATVSIPLFPLLREELGKRPRVGEYCFPEQAALYKSKPDALTVTLRRAFEAAGFGDTEPCPEVGTKKGKRNADATPLSDAEMLQAGRDRLVACTGFTRKVRANMSTIFEHYMSGGTLESARKELGLSKGGASEYIARIERTIGFPIVRSRRPRRTVPVRAPSGAHRQGLMRVNQRGFHAFRATWVTLALTAGVPVDLVRKVTGHTVTETVLTHYFQPGREDFRRAIQEAMPSLLTGVSSQHVQAGDDLTSLAAKVKDGTATPEETARLKKLVAEL
jgi:integrase